MKTLHIRLTVLFSLLLIISTTAAILFSNIIISAVMILLFVGSFFYFIKALLINPLHKMKREIDEESLFTYKGKDELGELAERLNLQQRRNQELIDKEKKNLIERVSYQENSKYLENVNDGLLFIDYGQIISEYYSKALDQIFDRSEIGNQHLSDFLYPQKERFIQERRELEKFILRLFHEPERIETIKEEENPLYQIWISRDDGKRILVDGTFRKVMEDGELVQLMIIFQDKTNEGILEKRLDDRNDKSDFEQDTLLSILRIGPGPFVQFIEESREVLQELRIYASSIEEDNLLDFFCRQIRSLRTAASYFDFRGIERLATNFEKILQSFREGNYSRKEAVDIILDDLNGHLDHIQKMVDKASDFLQGRKGLVVEDHRNEQDHFFDSLSIMMARLADEQEKEVKFEYMSDFDNYENIPQLKNPIIHLLRNALDYGIEVPSNREAIGKTPTGHIELRIHKVENGVKISVNDDGSGIDFEHVREIAIDKGFIKKEEKPGEANLIRTLFKNGFSGQSVGLDALKEDISKIGGSISVKTEKGKGSRFTIHLPSGQ